MNHPPPTLSMPLSPRRRPLLTLFLVATMVGATLAIVEAVNASSADASHFRSTQLTWEVVEVDDDGPATIEFTSTVAARQGFYAGNPSLGDSVNPVRTFDMGDGQSVSGMDHTVIAEDAANDWILMEATFEYTYEERGEYTASWDQCCRLRIGDGHINNDNLDNRIETFLDLSGDPGDPLPASNSPVSLTAPIVDCPINDECVLTVPAVDAQGFDLVWRFATGDEATTDRHAESWSQPGDPHADNDATVDASNGQYVWDTTGAELAAEGTPTYYSTQVMIEKLDGDGNIVATTGVDFFIRMGEDENQPPAFLDPTPADGSTIRASLGSEITFDVVAEDPDEGDEVTLSLLGVPSDADVEDDGPANPVSGTFSWTPDERGSTLVTLTAQDDVGLGAVPRSVTLVAEPVADLALAPESAISHVGDTHTVVATTTDDAGEALRSAEVTFEIVDGPHEGETDTIATDSDGQATFSYDGTAVGTDTIIATHTTATDDDITSDEATMEWTEVIDVAETAEPVEAEPDFTG